MPVTRPPSRLAPTRPAAVALSLAVSLTLASLAPAGVFVDSAPDGPDATSGVSTPGGAGSSIFHVEDNPYDATNSTTLNAGNGGAGSAPAGAGGDGGNANATASSNNAYPGLPITLSATAIAGNGGSAPGGGAPGRGGDASAFVARAVGGNQDLTADALSFGGNGGNSPAGSASTAGNGGNATASASVSLDDATLALSLTAVGGTGGHVLAGTGNGGHGGDTSTYPVVVSSAANERGPDFYAPELSVSVALTGGSGGQGSGAGFHGGNGTAPFANPVSTFGFGTGDVAASVTVTGGSGGAGVNGAAPGQGATVSLNDAVSGLASAGATLSLTQTAIAGNGGSADSDTAAPGAPAYSSLHRPADTAAAVQTFVSAVGGNGGAGTGSAFGGRGGDATAELLSFNQQQGYANVVAIGGAGGSISSSFGIAGNGANAAVSAYVYSATSDPTLYAEARGGNGGDATGLGNMAGNGGNASIFQARAESLALGATLAVTARLVGGNGGDGYDGASAGNGAGVTAYNLPSVTAAGGAPSVSLTQEAVGGNGGNATGSGNAGLAGAASSSLFAIHPAGALTASVTATAGNGGSTHTIYAPAASGALASAGATLWAPGSVDATVTATGGNGGDSDGSSAGSGAYATIDPSVVTSATSSATLSASARGGNGGGHYLPYASFGTGAGGGGNVSLDNAIDGDSPVSINLSQSATGGDGGYSAYNAPGLAGNASSSLLRSKATAALQVATSATGGTGGARAHDLSAAAGGTANTLTLATNIAGSADASATSHGGAGGLGSYGASGGLGGNADASTTSITSGDNHPSSAFAAATSGSGGNVSYIPDFTVVVAGHAGHATAAATATGSGNSPVVSSAIATAGAGGNASHFAGTSSPSAAGYGGIGGYADAFASGTAEIGLLTVSSQANGGAGGQPLPTAGFAGPSGDATATAYGTGAGAVDITATASGGYGGPPAAFPGAASAHAYGSGATGHLSASASSDAANRLLTSYAGASATPTTTHVEARTAVGRYAPDIVSPPTNLQSFAFLTALPTSTDTAAAFAARPNAQSLLGDGTFAPNVVALAALGIAAPASATGPQSYTAGATVSLDSLYYTPSDDLYLALLTPASAGRFSNITLEIYRQSNATLPSDPPILSKTLTSLAAATDYFRDHALNLGTVPGFLETGFVGFDVKISADTDAPGARFAATVALATRHASVNRWIGTSGGSASDPANWSAGAVPAPGSALDFAQPNPSFVDVALPTDLTFSTLNLDSRGAYSFRGPGTLHSTSTPATIQGTNGNGHSFYAPVAFHANTDLVGGSLFFAGPVTLDPGVNLTARAGATVTLHGPVTVPAGGASLTINEGSAANISYPAFYPPAPLLTVHNNGHLAIDITPQLATIDGTGSTHLAADAHLFVDQVTQHDLTLDGNSILTLHANLVPTTSRLTSLTLAPTSTVDLTNNTLVIAASGSSPAAAIRQYLHDARLLSSSSDATHRLGYLDSGTDITLLLTLAGDANVNGRIDPDDYALIDRAFAKSLTNAHWTDGDFNYDGSVTSADYLLLDTTYGQSHGYTFAPDFLSQRESQFGPTYVSQLLTSVPEPSAALIAVAAPLFSHRPSRRRHRRS